MVAPWRDGVLRLPLQVEALPESVQSLAGHPAVVWTALLAVVVTGLLLRSPGYAERTTDRILDDPLESFLYGVGSCLLAGLVVGLLSLTIVGILVAVPIVATVLALSALGYLAVGRALGAGWRVAAVSALGLAAVVGTLVDVDVRAGAVAGFLVGCLGVGGAVLDHVERTVRDGTSDDEETAEPGEERGSASSTPPDASAANGPPTDER